MSSSDGTEARLAPGQVWRSIYAFSSFRVVDLAPRGMVVCQRVWRDDAGRWHPQINPGNDMPRANVRLNSKKFGTTYRLEASK